MPRNAPAATAAANSIIVSFHMIDRNGDKKATSYRVAATTTNAQIEAAAAKLSAATQALLYKISRTEEWAGLPTASSAAPAASRDSVQDLINVLFKTVTGQAQSAYIPAPYEGLLANDGDNVDVSDTRYTEWLTSIEIMLANAYEPLTARYVQRRETNKAVPAEAPPVV